MARNSDVPNGWIRGFKGLLSYGLPRALGMIRGIFGFFLTSVFGFIKCFVMAKPNL